MGRVGKVLGTCLAGAVIGWTVQAQYHVDGTPGSRAPGVHATPEQARRALVENCVSGSALQKRLDAIKAGKASAIDCVWQRRTGESPTPRSTAGTADWPDRYVVQIQAQGGLWLPPQGRAHGRVEDAWDEAIGLCEAERAGGMPSAVKIADRVTGLERVVDCRAPTRR